MALPNKRSSGTNITIMDDLQHFDPKIYKHWIEDRVRYSDLDPVGHVNNNSISQYFENARAYLYRLIAPTWPLGDSVFVLARTAVDYHRELHMPADLRIGSAIARIGRSSLTICNALFHGTHGVAWCESVSVLIDQKTRKPVEIPILMREHAKEYLL